MSSGLLSGIRLRHCSMEKDSLVANRTHHNNDRPPTTIEKHRVRRAVDKLTLRPALYRIVRTI